MKSAVENLSPTRVRLTVEVPFEELKPNLDSAYKEIARQVTIPGFRKGKVPPQLIDQRVGRGAVLEQAVNDALPQLYSDALQENTLEPMGQPEVNLKELVDGEEVSFTAEVDVRPEITVPDYTGLEASVDSIQVTEAEIEEQVTNLRERFGSLIEVERAAAEGDHLTLDLSAAKDGEAIEDAQVSGISYRVGSNSMFEGLDDAVREMSAGETKTFQTSLAGIGDDVDVTVTVQNVKEQQLPELDDDFAQMASEFDTLVELRDDLSDQLARQKRLEQAGNARDAVLEKLLEQVEIPLPDAAVNEEIEARQQQINQQLEQVGMTREQYLENEGMSEEDFAADMDKRVRDALRAQLLLDEIAKQAELSVSEQELTEHLVRRAQQSGVSPDAYAQHAVENNHVPQLVREVVRGKALAEVVENANVVDEEGEHVELKRLQPDGSIATDEDVIEVTHDDDADEGSEGEADASQQTESSGEASADDTKG